jgi:tocopherol cyclase
MYGIIGNLWRPASYHGHGKSRRYFEGWYFKLVDARRQRRLAVIPGVFLGETPADSHSFVQTLDGATGQTSYHRYPLADFWAHPSEFDISVGPNRFSEREITLNIATDERQVIGHLRFTGVTPWPVTWLSPGIMDWYTFTPFMECYHGVLSLDHTIEGMLAIDGQAVDFHGGRGYIEKDWGAAFPRAWVWMQSNHFEQSGVSLTASVARIPWLGSAFRGFIVGLLHDGVLYRFATYTGARIERLQVTEDHVYWTICGPVTLEGRTRNHRLEITAQRDEQGVNLLHAPARTAMVQRVLESLTARIDVRLTRLEPGGDTQLFTGSGQCAGLEIGGAIEEIL